MMQRTEFFCRVNLLHAAVFAFVLLRGPLYVLPRNFPNKNTLKQTFLCDVKPICPVLSQCHSASEHS